MVDFPVFEPSLPDIPYCTMGHNGNNAWKHKWQPNFDETLATGGALVNAVPDFADINIANTLSMTTGVSSNFASNPFVIYMKSSVSKQVSGTYKWMQYSSESIKLSWGCSTQLKLTCPKLSARVTSGIFPQLPHGLFARPITWCLRLPQVQLLLDGTCCLMCPS